ncbi:MAG: sodium:proton antiporter [Alphaproteobacteria bacterium]|nr:sodium:proton antiporter [Alphaproteobacteria bacterium]
MMKIEKSFQKLSLHKFFYVLIVCFLCLFPTSLLAEGGLLPGASLSLWWAFPFVGMLLSIALLPLLFVHFWEAHYGKISCVWASITFLGLITAFGFSTTKHEVFGTFLHHYLPFIIIIGSLYTIAGGIRIEVESHATPLINTALLAVGTILAGWIGTTGAAMLLLRPLLHINLDRQNRIHHMIFFIFLVSNIGGALTPLGDPPLFLGFLNGVSFFWPLEYLGGAMIVVSLPLLAIFYGMDIYFARKEGLVFHHSPPRIRIKGRLNGLLFFGVIGVVLLSGIWKPEVQFHVGGIALELQNVVRDGSLIILAIISWLFTPQAIHEANHFSWGPLKEVAKLFFGIFMTVIPVIAILDAGLQGAMAPLISLVDVDGHPNNVMYFWLSGVLSSFLDNAPTYLVFFHMAGGDASHLMTSFARTLEAISLGSVFMGAMTYIGNAPNFMVKAIAESHGIKMPSFFGYMFWSVIILLPLFFLLALWRF